MDAAAAASTDIVLIIAPTGGNADLSNLRQHLMYTDGSDGDRIFWEWMTAMIKTEGALEVRMNPKIADAVYHILSMPRDMAVVPGLALMRVGTVSYNDVIGGRVFIDDVVSPTIHTASGQPFPVHNREAHVYFRKTACGKTMTIDSAPATETLTNVPLFPHVGQLVGVDAATMGIRSYQEHLADWKIRDPDTGGKADTDEPGMKRRANIVAFGDPAGFHMHEDHMMARAGGVVKGGLIVFKRAELGADYTAKLSNIIDLLTGSSGLFNCWMTTRKQYTKTVMWRPEQVVVDAVRKLNATYADPPLEILDEGTPGYRLVEARKAHINDAVEPCTLHQQAGAHCTAISAWVHVRDITRGAGAGNVECPAPTAKGGMIIFFARSVDTPYIKRLRVLVDKKHGADGFFDSWFGNAEKYSDMAAWYTSAAQYKDMIAWRCNQDVVSAVQELSVIAKNPSLCVLDESTPGYRLVMEGKGHITDVFSPCTLYQSSVNKCTPVNVHVHAPDITTLLTTYMDTK